MTAVYPTLPKLAVRDGFDDDDLTDIDDEVFIRDGKNGCLKLDDDGGVKRPLMAPRRKCKKSCNFKTHKLPYKVLLGPLCYGVMALIVLLGLIVLCIFTVNIFPMPITILKNWLSHDLKDTLNESNIVPCTSLSTKILWTRSLPKLTSESPLRSNDVNADGVEDIIIGFSTGLDMMDISEYICTLYFEGQIPCLGGVLALNGKTGETLWTHWTDHAIFSVDCGLDVTNDKIKDCIISGRGGVLHAVNGHDGSSIWEIPIQDISTLNEQKLSDIYDAKFVADINGDEIGDVIASHTIESGGIHTSEILIISGVNGNILYSTNLPDTEQLFLAPQNLVHPDGENMFVLVTSSQKQSGGLYIIPQVDLIYGNLKLRKLHHNTGKGALLPPILVDITLDGVEDIIAAMFNSTIIAYDGLTFEPIWNYTIPNSEVISIPIPGYYNDDNIPDFMIKHQIGSGYPTYYYTIATIIDGKTGKSLLQKPIEDSLSKQMSGLSVTVEDFGNDWFLYWSVDCLNYEGVKEKYQFLRSESLMSETHADLCKLRFNSSLTTNLFALSQHVGPPGISLYFSEDWKFLEYNNSVNLKLESYVNAPFVSERSAKIHKTDHKDSNDIKQESEDKYGIINKYNDDAIDRENYENYKEPKKMNDFQNDNAGDFNGDYAWKHANKLTRENMRTNKDYDVSYDTNVNTGDEQSVDYPQADEIREQRSNINNKVNDQLSVTNKTNIFTKVTDYLADSNVENMQVVETESTVERKREISSLHDSIKDITNSTDEEVLIELLVSTVETPKAEDILNNSLNIHTEYNNDISNSTENESVVNQTNVYQEANEIVQVYTHNFPNIVQNEEEDANIEKIFKRESLKNQNKKESSKQGFHTLSELQKKSQIKLRKQRKKRETEVKPGQRVYGVQKQPQTGILLPSFSKPTEKTSIDLIFSTFWLPSSEVPVILLQQDLDCIHRKKVLSDKKLQYKDNDDIIKECLAERGISYKVYQEATDRENFKITLGQMTVYRMKLECVCPEDMLPHQTCKNISLQQSWPEHLGLLGNGYFKPLHKSNV